MSIEPRFSSNFWPKGSEVRMINVPWDSSYKDIVQFDDEAARDAWLEDRSSENMATTQMTYIAPGASIVLPCPVTHAELYNYIYVTNPRYYITDDEDYFYGYLRRYCYFITGAEWLSPASCRVTLQLDVWTTWAPFVRFTRAYIAQGHAAIANKNLWDGTDLAQITPAKMRRYLSCPEDVDPGGEYYPIYTTWTDITMPEQSATQVAYIGVMSSIDLSQPWGTVNNPSIYTATGSIQQGMLAGVQVVYFRTTDFINLLNDLRDAPWVSRNIMQIWLAPGRMAQMQAAGTIHGYTYYRPTVSTPGEYNLADIDVMSPLKLHYATDILVAPKMLTAPYSFIELNSFEGSPLILKPQRTNSLGHLLIYGKGIILAPWDRLCVYPLYYGAQSPQDIVYTRMDIQGNVQNSILHAGDNLDAALWINDLPRFAFTSDGYLSWLANSAHSRAWSYQNNDWNYHKGALQQQLGYDQSVESMNLASRQYQENYNQQSNQAILQSVMQGIGGLSADPFETVGNIASTAMNYFIDASNRDLAAKQFTEQQQMSRSQLNQNNALANYALRGDYQQTIAQMAATQKDAEITSPSVVGSAGGNGWNYAMGLLGFRTTVKVAASGQEKILIGYFKRFGYNINEMIDMPRDLRLMDIFTYWRLQESFIEGNVTETAKQAIRGIFEKGTTVWSNPDQITYYSYNTSQNGINANNSFSY